MVEKAADALINYGALGIMALAGLVGLFFFVKFFLQEVHTTLSEIRDIVKDLKEISSERNHANLTFERTRTVDCFEKIVARMDANHKEMIGTLQEYYYELKGGK